MKVISQPIQLTPKVSEKNPKTILKNFLKKIDNSETEIKNTCPAVLRSTLPTEVIRRENYFTSDTTG